MRLGASGILFGNLLMALGALCAANKVRRWRIRLVQFLDRGHRQFALVLTPLSALADSFCEDLWFTRNALADRGGYCFSSTLGQAVFDNDGCTGSTSALAANDRALVSRIVELEAEAQCAVDTEAQDLDLVAGVPSPTLRPRPMGAPVIRGDEQDPH